MDYNIKTGTYGVLLREGKLTAHLKNVEEEAKETLANILPRTVKEQ